MAKHIYDPAAVEKKIQQFWEENHVNEIDLRGAENPFYVLMMFPYPSAEGLHVGNVYAFTGADVYGRHMRLRGYDVFEPIGFDAFGIHSENYAMKVNRHPSELIPSNIANFTRQLKMMGFQFDWRRTVDTTQPDYYQWDQWIFLQLYKAGFVYRDTKEVNFCPSCGTVIADEQVMPDGTCERHSDTMVERRKMPCWFFRITDFAEELYQHHDWLDWSERTRVAQRQWIGRSEGAEVDFALAGQTGEASGPESGPDPFTRDENIDEKLAARERAESAGLEIINLTPEMISPAGCAKVLRYLAEWYLVVPIGEDEDGTLVLATSNPAIDSRLRARTEREWKANTGRGVEETLGSRAITQAGLEEQLGGLKTRLVWADAERLDEALAERRWPHKIRVFTTRPDTLFGATYMVIAPEHPLVDLIAAPEQLRAIAEYRERCAAQSEEERTADKEKTGVDTGARAINPVNGDEIPVYISDYVLMGYGTGAIMAVPAHDDRDFAFAEKFGLPIRAVINPDPKAISEFKLPEKEDQKQPLEDDLIREAVLAGKLCWSGPGKGINSANEEVSLDDLDIDQAKARITEWLESKGLGVKKVTYRLRDWGISRQRYWGAPIPIIYDEQGNAHPVPEEDLPVMLPEMEDFRPKGDGRGPLAANEQWVKTTLPDGRPGRRETDVMDNFIDSAWYFLRYVDNENQDAPYDPELIEKWLPVDMYIGGNEHAVLHLMYTRFICMALHKAGVLKMGYAEETRGTGEPFRKFRAHGLILKDGEKMSKNKGNIVNPDEAVEDHGADTLRMYLMFLGPYTQGGDYRDDGINGMKRFLNRVYTWYHEAAQPVVPDEELPSKLRVKTHQTIKKVRNDIEALSYNTSISAIMELFNAATAEKETSEFVKETLILCLAPFAPHFAEEIWRGALGREGSIWNDGQLPDFQEELTKEDEVEIALQHQGKIKDRVSVPADMAKEELEKLVLSNEKIKKALGGREVRKMIVVPGRLVNVIG